MQSGDARLAHRQLGDLDVELEERDDRRKAVRRLLLVEAREHDRLEAGQQQDTRRIELVRIARANEIDALLQLVALGRLENRARAQRES